MFDREIVMDSLRKIRLAIETIMERANVVSDPNELLTSPGGMMRLDAICIYTEEYGDIRKDAVGRTERSVPAAGRGCKSHAPCACFCTGSL